MLYSISTFDRVRQPNLFLALQIPSLNFPSNELDGSARRSNSSGAQVEKGCRVGSWSRAQAALRRVGLEP